MLKEHGVEYRYRDYRLEPLSEKEIREVLGLLGLEARDVLRTRDRANRDLGLTGEEPEATVIAHMAEHPTLLQRPIGVVEGRAVLGRPVENLMSLVD